MAENKRDDMPEFLIPDAPRGRSGAAKGDLDEVLLGSSKTGNEDAFQVEGPLLGNVGNTMGLIMLGVALLMGVGFAFYVLSSEQRVEETKAFLFGNITELKTAGKKEQEALERRINAEARNRYGSVTLTYTPQNAKVILTELAWKETFDEFVERKLKGGADRRTGPEEKDIPNKTSSLAENEIVEALPLSDLPLMEKTEDEKYMRTLAYRVVLDRDGYYPRTFLFITDDFPGQTNQEGVEVMKWMATGPDMFQLMWSGADLMPKPEMMRPHYVVAIIEYNCLVNSPEGKKKTPDEIDIEFAAIKRRNKFATDTQWNEVEAALKANVELWPLIDTEIKAGKCDGSVPAPQ